ncbi:glycosyltransferase family 2 protein [Thalassospira sp.]|uniref:glycosyltransferase family 2 protein n=1 Tax=Thalassospira sp. TaxID=1912094 RepID=UPI002733E496|nr:glycosyltransferase family 2 protein [Thalassospira sp.]MDP2696765.1 glycosyltransferase family 2 protein [Thalassospira sp.]
MSPKISVVITAHNEEARLPSCLEHVSFADEIIVLCDKCTDMTAEIATSFGAKVFVGMWEIEGERRNFALSQAGGDWIVEVDADEHVSPELAEEIRQTVKFSSYAYHDLPVDNYIGSRLVRYGWGASFGKPAYGGLFRRGIKHWGPQRVHPAVKFDGVKGPSLRHPVRHYVDRNISDMIRRLDSYSTARAADLRDSGSIGSFVNNFRRMIMRFFKCYFLRKGYREGGLGFLVALFAGLFPIISYIKAKYEDK